MSYVNSSTCIENDRPTRSRRLRRGLVALSIAVALPGAFITAQAAASTEQSSTVAAYDANVAPDSDAKTEGQARIAPVGYRPCFHADVWYPSGTWISQGGYPTLCNNGWWIVGLH